MDENAVEKIKTEIEDNVNQIRKIETTLNSDNQKGLYESLKGLHYLVCQFAHWLSIQMRTQFEDEAGRKVKAIKDAGFSFKSIALDGIEFQTNDEGNIIKSDPNDDFPF
jgi:hypothetical protein